MFQTGGVRHQRNIMNYCNPKNIIQLNTVRRFGQPLTNKLKELIPEI